MNKQVTKIARITAGILLLAIGIVGVIVPIIPGIPMLFLGLGLLAPNHPLIIRLKQWIAVRRKRTPSPP